MLQCPICGQTVRGRADKKFCSDYCRNSFHNKLNSDTINYMRNVNNLLRRNRRILMKLNPKGKSTVSKFKLINNGFNFEFFTNEYKTKTGKTYRFCYDQGYVMLEPDLYAIVKKGEYIN